MGDADYRGRFLWYELMTTDPAAAKAFFTKVIGWGTETVKGLDMPYEMFKCGDNALAAYGLPKEARDGGTAHWIAYVGTPEIDKTFELATKLGAKSYVPPTDIPKVGRFAVLADPQGATFAVFTPVDLPAEQTGPPKIGEFSWHELVTTDHTAATGFYNLLFAWQPAGFMDIMMGLHSCMLRGLPLGGVFKCREMPFPPLAALRGPRVRRPKR
jgi:predicted enzyme related to lactoylglutathione lyase